MGLFSGTWQKPPGYDELYNMLMSQYNRGTPDWMRQEYERNAGQAVAGVRNWAGTNLPAGVASGNVGGMEMQARAQAMAGLPGETGRYKMGLLGGLQGLLSMQQYQPSIAGQALGSIGGNLMKFLALSKMMNPAGAATTQPSWDIFSQILSGNAGGGGMRYQPGMLGGY